VGVRHLPKPLTAIWKEQGDAGLRAVIGVGERLAAALETLVTTGRLPMLDRLERRNGSGGAARIGPRHRSCFG
jgi:DNA polymerase/3'-5' exonuclease PolX